MGLLEVELNEVCLLIFDEAFHPVAIPIRMLNTNQLCSNITIGAIRLANSDSHRALSNTAPVPPWAARSSAP